MRVRISPSRLAGTVTAPPSKSFAHRMMICASLGSGKSVIHGISDSEDMRATLDCIKALGAGYEKRADTITVFGCGSAVPDNAVFACRESGSTLRFMIPLSLRGGSVRFEGTERLLERGVGIYEELLPQKGIEISKDAHGIALRGKLRAGSYVLRGDVSSQFVTGLLFALPLLSGDSTVKVLPPVESRAYIDISLDVLESFGISITESEPNLFCIAGGQHYEEAETDVEGDWSNAAALYAFNAVGGSVRVNGLNADSAQGDRVCLEYLQRLRSPGAELDISNCPDLGPVLFAAAAAAGNGAVFTGTRRLRIKESDRATVMAQVLEKFGIKAVVEENSVQIFPGTLYAPTGALDSYNDHRIVMAQTLLMSKTGGVLENAQAVRKSYPDYFEVLGSLGLETEIEA